MEIYFKKSANPVSKAARTLFWFGPGFLTILWLSLVTLFHQPLKAEPRPIDVRWYSIYLGQQKIGYVKETGMRIQQKGIWYFKTVSESRIIFNRLGKKVEMVVNSEYLESEDGRLKKVVSNQLLSAQPVLIEAEVKEDKVSLKTKTGSRAFNRELPYTGTLLGPVGIGRLSSDKLINLGDKVEYRTLLAEISQIASGERILAGEEELDFGQGKIKTRKIEEKLSGLSYNRFVWVDEQGNEVKAVEPSPFGEMITLLSDEDEALSGLEKESPSQEQYRATLIKANVRLPQSRALDRMVVRLKHKKPELGWPEMENEYQQVLEKTGNDLVMELRIVKVESAKKTELSAEEKERYLKANAYLDCEDQEVKRVAREVAGFGKDNFKKALLLRDWVSKNLSFDLGFIFAPASEVIRSKRGTCAGYATLLASLLRATGIPSRYLIGLAYINGVWGGHAWVEAWINGRWVPLDSALPSPGVADPARLAVARSSLEDGLGESLFVAQKVFGYLDIEILEFSLKGRTIKVSEPQPLYEIRDGIYWNPGLQISLKAPEGFDFSDLDKVWPDKTLLTLKGPEGKVVRLIQESWFPADDQDKRLISLLNREVKEGKLFYHKVWGKRCPVLAGSEKSAASIMNGLDLFVVTAEGKNSESLLKMVLENFQNKLVVD